MIKTNVADAKARLSEYLDQALAGERIVICRHNKPIAELRALEETRVEPRPVGPLPGRPTFEISPAFFEPLPDDELDQWESGGADGALVSGRRVSNATRVAERKTTFRRGGKPAAGRRRRS